MQHDEFYTCIKNTLVQTRNYKINRNNKISKLVIACTVIPSNKTKENLWL